MYLGPLSPNVFAKRLLVDGEKTYMPGDRIESGQLYEHAEYYARLGHVLIVTAKAQPDKPKRTRKKAN